MSVSPMKVISVIGLKEDINRVIKVLGDSQSFEPEPVTSFYSNTENFVSLSEQNQYADLLAEFDNSLSVAHIEPALVDIKHFEPSDLNLLEYCKAFIEQLDQHSVNVAEKKQAIEQCVRSIEQTSHFMGVKLDMQRVRACEYIKPSFGRIPVNSMRKLEEDYKDNPYVMFFTSSVDKEYCWGVYMAPVNEADKIDRIFSGLYFERYDASEIDGTPEQYTEKLKKNRQKLEEELSKAESKRDQFVKDHFNECMKYYTKLTEKAIYQNVKGNAMIYNGDKESFIICGWIPADIADTVTKNLDKIKSVEYSTDDAINQLGKSPPIKLKYNWFATPYKFYVDMYGVPKYNEMDPTTFVAITYTILFGVMFGDFGHGIVLAIAGIIMYKLKGLKVGKVLVPCGICSSLFGILFGSFFGFEHAFDGMYKAWFGFEEKPIDVMGKDIINVILASVAIGILLVLLAMCLNVYSSLKQKNMGSALFGSNGLAGLVMYGFACAGIVSLFAFGINLFNIITIPLLIILPLVLIFLAEPLGRLVEGKEDWKPEKWGDYCVQNAFEMFETVLSYLSNTMSFLRVGAFVMVHAGMMIVVFTLMELVGGLPSIGGILVLVIGNLFVIGLEGLLVSIQTLRLEFYEMFSRFYSGAGRPYNPVVLKRLNTK